MTVNDAIRMADQQKPNEVDEALKRCWLYALEGQIRQELSIIGSISPETMSELCVSAPYDKLYPAYLIMRVCLENGELDNYNRESAIFNRLWMAFASVTVQRRAQRMGEDG